MWSIILAFFEDLAFGFLGLLVRAVSRRVMASGLDVRDLDYIQQLVDSAEKNAGLDTSVKKFEWVIENAAAYVANHKIDLSLSVLRVLIEMSVQYSHASKDESNRS